MYTRCEDYTANAECPQVRERKPRPMVGQNNVRKNAECFKHMMGESRVKITEAMENVLQNNLWCRHNVATRSLVYKCGYIQNKNKN